jgi:PhnB protein
MSAQPVVPYLTVRSAVDAIAFYQKAFGATETMRMAAEDGKRLMHAELAINGGTLFLSDEFSEHGGPTAPATGDKPAVAVALALTAPAEVDATFSRAVSAGAEGTMEPADQFWGARFAMLTDPFGHRWMLNAPLPQA